MKGLLARRRNRRHLSALDAALELRRDVLATPGGRAYLENLARMQPVETLSERYFQVLLSITEDAGERARIQRLALRANHDLKAPRKSHGKITKGL